VHSRFEQVLLLDADNVAVVDPASLFEAPQLAEIGAIAWPDRERLSEDNPIWELCRVPYRSEPAWETGQLLVEKSRCWPALQIAVHMNMHSETFYPHTHGDKDTFHLAWILAGTRWAMPDYPARSTITGLYQRDFAGRLIFQHRSQAKWRLSGENQLAPDFRHEAECLRFLSELRDRWSGRIDAVPPRTAQDLETEDGLKKARWFHLDEPGAGRRLVELLASNRVGIGASRDCLLRWYVQDGVMTLDGRVRALPPLSPQSGAPGSFAASPGGPPIELHPAPEAGRDALGATAAAMLERFARDRTITEDDAVTTLFTLGQVGDLSDALQRARSRWSDSDEARRAIERAAQRLGGGYPSEDFRTRPGYESL
jgi:hypothetical protein